ncbi:hypothetical protein O181_097119 [Austropuccinia psidii MF-1]|uniref:Integrase catalytic domain-containing protein n=1 Tax=Austropuccinia psidii MF-1 TaxID=1389203 RepID=A0A9Q3PDB0_9BASI|nr:hypothetical protein [Austropuccinia psidii MF-1]
MNESLNQPISSLSDIRGLEKLSSSNFFTWQRGIVSSLGMRNLRDMLLEPPSSVKIDPIYLKKKEMVYYFIVGHLDDENYDTFVSDEDEEPYQLWNSIKEHYASSSGENIASKFGKLFSIKFPPSSSALSKAMSSFCSTLKLLRGLSPSLFAAEIMVQVLAFFVLRLLPETCRQVSTAVFHSIKVSAKLPTVEESFKEIQLNILRRSGIDEQTSLALQLRSKPKKELCHKGKHNPLANHSESNCFQLFPEKRETYHHRSNDKSQPVVGSALGVCNNVTSVLNKPVLDSGCSNTIAPTSDLFSNISPSKEILFAANALFSTMVPLLKGFKGCSNLFDQNGNLILSTKIVNNVLLIDTPISNIAFSSLTKIPLIIHNSLGHINNRVASKMFPEDLCGPISPASRGGNRYIFQIIDGHSHMRFIYLLSAKSECFDSFVRFQNLVENLKGQTIKTVISDNGGEFVNARFKNLFDLKGILHLSTAPYTPQQNPVAERGNWSLLERIRVMMRDNCVPSEWWGEALAMAVFLLNRTPVSTLNLSSPLRTLCMLVGIQEGHRTYQLFDPKTGYIHISHNFIFKDQEACWPTHALTLLPSAQEPLLLPSMPLPLFTEPHATLICTSTPPIPSEEDASLTHPPLVEHPKSVSTLENGGSLPKGWTDETVPMETPRNIDSSILITALLWDCQALCPGGY